VKQGQRKNSIQIKERFLNCRSTSEFAKNMKKGEDKESRPRRKGEKRNDQGDARSPLEGEGGKFASLNRQPTRVRAQPVPFTGPRKPIGAGLGTRLLERGGKKRAGKRRPCSHQYLRGREEKERAREISENSSQFLSEMPLTEGKTEKKKVT